MFANASNETRQKIARELGENCEDVNAKNVYNLADTLYEHGMTEADVALETATKLHAQFLGITVERLWQNHEDRALHPVTRKIVHLAEMHEDVAYEDGCSSTTVKAELAAIFMVLDNVGRLDLWVNARKTAERRIKYHGTHTMMHSIEKRGN